MNESSCVRCGHVWPDESLTTDGMCPNCDIDALRKERDEAKADVEHWREQASDFEDERDDAEAAITEDRAEVEKLREAGAMVDCLRTWLQHERMVHESRGKGGQSVGESPRLMPSVLRELERMLRPEDAAYVLGNWDSARAQLAEAQRELTELSAAHTKLIVSTAADRIELGELRKIKATYAREILAGRGPTP